MRAAGSLDADAELGSGRVPLATGTRSPPELKQPSLFFPNNVIMPTTVPVYNLALVSSLHLFRVFWWPGAIQYVGVLCRRGPVVPVHEAIRIEGGKPGHPLQS